MNGERKSLLTGIRPLVSHLRAAVTSFLCRRGDPPVQQSSLSLSLSGITSTRSTSSDIQLAQVYTKVSAMHRNQCIVVYTLLSKRFFHFLYGVWQLGCSRWIPLIV
jgi:hypothetical protein